MKTTAKTTVLLLSTLLCLMLVGCGQEESDSRATITTSLNAGKTAETERTVAVTAEPEKNKSDEDLFSYYDALNEEYNKYGRMYPVPCSIGYTIVPGKIIYVDPEVYSNREPEYAVKVFDVSQKSIIAEFGNIEPVHAGDDYSKYYYSDVNGGYIYTAGSKDLEKRELNGNIVAELETEWGERLIKVVEDGTVFSAIGDQYYIYSSDWKSKSEIPLLQADAEHGLKVDIPNYEIRAKYKNKIYVYTLGAAEFSGIYCFDTDTNTWEKTEFELFELSFDRSITIGRYWLMELGRNFSGSKIYDMETDTFVDVKIHASKVHEPAFAQTYNGGKCHLGFIQRGQNKYDFCKGSYPSNGSDFVYEILLSIEIPKDAFVSAVNEQYYVYEDKHGVFLREYGKGEDGEITIYLK